MNAEERIAEVDAAICRLVHERHKLAAELARVRVAARVPSYRHAEQIETAGLYVHEFGPDYGPRLAALVLCRPRKTAATLVGTAAL